MSSTQATLERFIVPALRELEGTVDGVAGLAPVADTPLLGGHSSLDSMAVVTLVITVEARVNDELGTALSLTSEHAMSRRHSPFRTLGTLAAYIDELLEERAP